MSPLTRFPPATPVRVVLADGQPLVRSGLARLLAGQSGVDLVAEAADAADLVRAAAALLPDVVVLDLSLPGGALDAVRQLRAHDPPVEILLYGLPEDEALFVAALDAGVKGFADRGADFDYLVTSLANVAHGELMVSPGLARHLAARYTMLLERVQPAGRGRSLDITEREIEVLRTIASGCSNRTAAQVLGLSEHTVRAHLRSISRKLGVQNRVQAVSEATRLGLIAAPGPPTGPRRAG